jgi:type IV pilus assembly protein PilF
MIMRHLYVIVFSGIFMLQGCGSQPTVREQPGAERTKSTTSDTDDTALGRARIHTELAANYLEIGNLAVALEEAGIAQRADPTYVPAYNVAGLIYMQLRDERLAEQSFRQALSINPRDADTLNNYGTFMCERKRENEGIKLFMLAVTDPLYRFPDRSYLNAGVCAKRKRDFNEAEGYLRTAVKMQPQNYQAWYQLAEIAYSRKNYLEARSFLQRLAPVARGSAETLWLMLRAERQGGDPTAVESLAHQLRNSFPDANETRLLEQGRFD